MQLRWTLIAALAVLVRAEAESAHWPQHWDTLSPLARDELHARALACCVKGDLDKDLRYIVWPPETAPARHWHPCCGDPTQRALLQRGVTHGSTFTRFAAALRRRRPVRIAAIGSSVASVPIAGCTAKVDAVAQDWGSVAQRCPPGRGWARMFAEWLDAAWPADGGRHEVFALGRGGCGADCWADCMLTHVPATTELYILDMGLVLSGDDHADFDAGASPSADGRGGAPPSAQPGPPRGSSLERIVRRLLALPGRPAVVLLNFFPWCRRGAAACMDALKGRPGYKTKLSGREWREFERASRASADHGAAQRALLNARNVTAAEQAPVEAAPGVEEMNALRAHRIVEAVGRRYGVPVVSTGDALFDALRDGSEDLYEWATPHLTFTNSFRSELRPGYRMQALAASLLVEAIVQAIAPTTANLASEPDAGARRQALGVPLAPTRATALPPPLYDDPRAPRAGNVRSCYAFGFARDYWDAANWLYALRAAPPTERSTGWEKAKLGLESPLTGRQHRRAALRVGNASAGAAMVLLLDTTPVGGGRAAEAVVQLSFAAAADGSARLAVRCESGCACAGLLINSTGRQLRAARQAGRQKRRRRRRASNALAPWEFASFPVTPSATCRLVLEAPPCDRDSGACELALLEISVREGGGALDPRARGGHVEL